MWYCLKYCCILRGERTLILSYVLPFGFMNIPEIVRGLCRPSKNGSGRNTHSSGGQSQLSPGSAKRLPMALRRLHTEAVYALDFEFICINEGESGSNDVKQADASGDSSATNINTGTFCDLTHAFSAL